MSESVVVVDILRTASGKGKPGGALHGVPLVASGVRLMCAMIHHLEHTGGRFGLQTMCEGGGMANATMIEAL